MNKPTFLRQQMNGTTTSELYQEAAKDYIRKRKTELKGIQENNNTTIQTKEEQSGFQITETLRENSKVNSVNIKWHL